MPNEKARAEANKELIESKIRAYKHYKDHKNLNKLYYSTDNKEIKKVFDDWSKEFYFKFKFENSPNTSYTNLQTEDKIEPKSNFKNANAIEKRSIHLTIADRNEPNRKFNLQLRNNMFSNSKNNCLNIVDKVLKEMEEEYLFLDEMVNFEYPKEYESSRMDSLLENLGKSLMGDRLKISKNYGGNLKLANDQFRLLLWCLRLKKKFLYEKEAPKGFQTIDAYLSQTESVDNSDDIYELVSAITA